MVQEWDLRDRPTEANLASHCREIWECFRGRPRLMENLVESMPRRLAHCIEAGGDFTKY